MKTVDVSGFGGGYENACQQMIQAALTYFESNPVIENDKELEKVMLQACNNDASGAMYYSALVHAKQRVELGEENYFAHFADTPERIYDWDGTKESCPKATQ